MDQDICKSGPIKVSLSISLIAFLAAPLFLITRIIPYFIPEADFLRGAVRHSNLFLDLSALILLFSFPFLIAAAKNSALRTISILGFASTLFNQFILLLERTGHIEFNDVTLITAIMFISIAEILYLTYLTLYAKGSGSTLAAKFFSFPLLLKIIQMIIVIIPKESVNEDGNVVFHLVITGFILTLLREVATGALSLNLLVKQINRDSLSVPNAPDDIVPQPVLQGIKKFFRIYLIQILVMLSIGISMIFKDQWEHTESFLLLALLSPIFLFHQCMIALQILRAKTVAFKGTAMMIFVSLIVLICLSLIYLSILQFLPNIEEMYALTAAYSFLQFVPGMVLFYGLVLLLRKAAFFAERKEIRKRTTALFFYPLIAIIFGISLAVTATIPAIIAIFLALIQLVIGIFFAVFFLKTLSMTAKIDVNRDKSCSALQQ